MTYRRIDRLPLYVLYTFTGIVVATFVVTMSLGKLPQRRWSGAILLLYFGTLLATQALACLLSGNTLAHDYRTGTIRRETSPTAFWVVTVIQAVLGAWLLVIGVVWLIVLRH